MKAETYVKQFADYDTAFEWMNIKNRAFARAGNKVDILCVVRGALSCRLAKDLLLPSDKTIDEQIKELEPSVLRLEKEAEKVGIKLNGYARQKLNKLYEQKKGIYVCIG